MVRCAVVVAPHHRSIVGIRANHRNLSAVLLQRQHVVIVLQEYDGLASHVERLLCTLLGRHRRIGNLRPLHEARVVHLAQVEATLQQSDDVLVDLSLADESAPDGLGDAAISVAVATFHIGAGEGSLRRGGDGRRGTLVRRIEIADGSAVAHHEVFESPLVAQNLLQQTCAATARIIVESLVGTHHLAHLRILHQRLEGRHVGLPEVAHRHIGEVDGVASVFRSAVYGIVFGTRPELAILRRLRSLQSAHHLCAHHGGQIGVFAIGLLATSPARVAEDVHVRCPYAQAVELLVFALQVVHAVVILRTKLGAGHVEHPIHHVRVPRCRHCDGFGKHRYVSHVGGAVKGFAPPEEFLDAQSGNGGTLVEHQLRFLFERQSLTEVDGSLMCREVWILIGQLLCCSAEAVRQCAGQQ